MAITSRYGWEVADGPDAPNVPFALLVLASDIEETVGPVDDEAAAATTSAAAANTSLTKLGLSGKKVQFGRTLLYPNVQGLTNLPFPVAFAAAPTVVIMQPADTSTVVALVRPVEGMITATDIYAQLLGSGGAIVTSGAHWIQWIAIGTAA